MGAFLVLLISLDPSLNSKEVVPKEVRACLEVNSNSKGVVHLTEEVYLEVEISSSKETVFVVAQISSVQPINRVFHNRMVHLYSAL